MSSSLFSNLTTLVPALLHFFAYVVILGACIFGVMHPSLRREFIWFGLSALLRCVASMLSLVPQLMNLEGSGSLSIQNVRLWYEMSSGVGLFSTLLLIVGTILLAVRARSVPVVRN